MNLVEDTGSIVTEPKWVDILTDDLEIVSAQQHWRRITEELRDRDVLAAVNGHAILRLVIAYITFETCAREVAENGVVNKPKRGNPKAIARLSPYYQAMREAGADAERLEADLGLSPRRRNSVGKVTKGTRKATPADRFLKSVANAN